ncbi:SusC/RagA family TonB-linked outer membrane protein [Robertkochia solimangrovi]|uniref:SusC/RagA family TonB-linked outer membrane protein n=1 Tax=Robertkochia solimangrovi TaxID=2213046 RepID=UPI00117CBDFF|nr:TonB-dependent receptor [Robertkochia solimangrovi]TRZ42494.1 hypothetical protein DMZ48_13405 [Robertkochia solimangrovi]
MTNQLLMKVKAGGHSLLLLFLLLFSVSLSAQNSTVSGTVSDKVGPLPGVSVIVVGSNNGTTTDFEGNFSIPNVSPQATLQFSYIGFSTQEVPLNGRTVINVTMQEDTQELDEVVVVGYGTMERSNVTGAITTVNSEAIENIPVPNVLEALRGQVSGVQVSRPSGQPGSSVNFTIRGVNSLSLGNSPLIVVDGIPLLDGNLAELNPDDIESINVLKDAGASSIYGVSGTNGVVLITTKAGRAGRASFSVRASTGFTNLVQELDMMNADQYVQFKIDAVKGTNGYDGSFVGASDVLSDPVELRNYIAGNEIDWHDELLRTGIVNNFGVSMNGGTEKFNYYLSGDAYLEQGITYASDYNRYSFRMNADYRAADWIKTGARVQLSKSTADERGQTLDQNGNADFGDYVENSPLGRIYLPDGSYAPTANQNQFQFNPFWRYSQSQVDREVRRVLLNPYIEANITKGLTYTINASVENRDELYRSFYSSIYDDGTRQGTPRRIQVNNAENNSYLMDNILNYNTTISDKHEIDATLVYGFQKNNYFYSSLSGRGIQPSDEGPGDPATYDLLGYYGINTMTDENTQAETQTNKSGKQYFIARMGYTYDSRYVVNVTYRRDGSSRFGGNNKWGNFGSASFAWNIHNEAFFKDSQNVNNLKFRLSYGILGNDQLATFRYLSNAASISYYFGTVLTGFTTNPESAPNANLKWEESKQFNVGLDFAFFDNRLSGSLEYFNTKTEDLLLEEQLPITSGYTRGFSNFGKTENKGVEIAVNADIIRGADFTWNTNITWATNDDKIVNISREGEAGEEVLRDEANGWFVGQNINVIFDYEFDGIYQVGEEDLAASMHPTINGYGVGDPKIVDQNGDGVITTDDRTFLGSPSTPDWYGGWRNTFSYKGFELDVLLEGRFGVTKVNGYYGSLQSGINASNMINVDYWTPENPSNEFPQPSLGAIPFRNAWSVRDASFVAIRNVSIGYTMQPHHLKNLPFDSVKFYIQGNNLHYFTDLEDSYSPEIDPWNFPITKVWTFGTTLTF